MNILLPIFLLNFFDYTLIEWQLLFKGGTLNNENNQSFDKLIVIFFIFIETSNIYNYNSPTMITTMLYIIIGNTFCI